MPGTAVFESLACQAWQFLSHWHARHGSFWVTGIPGAKHGSFFSHWHARRGSFWVTGMPGMAVFESLAWLDLEQSPWCKRESNPGSPLLEAQRRMEARRCIRQDSGPNTLPTELFRPPSSSLWSLLVTWICRTIHVCPSAVLFFSVLFRFDSLLPPPPPPPTPHRPVGLVVKASASRAEGYGFESRLRRDFFGVESYQWLQNWHSSGYPARRLAL